MTEAKNHYILIFPTEKTQYVVFMNNKAIAESALDLQRAIWRLKEVYCPQAKGNPLLCLAPEIACRHMGYTFSRETEFGDPRFTGGRIIGQLDMTQKRIGVAENLPFAEQRFTAAHEIGHLILHGHHGDMTMHRERPQFGNSPNRPPREREADYFAACYLIPEEPLRGFFTRRFGHTLPLRMTEQLAWQLAPTNPDQLLKASIDSLDRELALAKYEGSALGRFRSLANIFGVSAKAMAWRLKELKFIQWP